MVNIERSYGRKWSAAVSSAGGLKTAYHDLYAYSCRYAVNNPMNRKKKFASGLILGIAMGTAIGVATDDLAVWIGVGVALGAGMGSGGRKEHKNQSSEEK
ncbi:MAG: hypothetical protein RLN88_09390 [Ekhidna sp.]|uniref:hypothetical protein n=1 Tax=Ekhidna sp. TaxID=2608089 RepID=UPI0032F0359A